jgi:hypothetical protein
VGVVGIGAKGDIAIDEIKSVPESNCRSNGKYFSSHIVVVSTEKLLIKCEFHSKFKAPKKHKIHTFITP